MPQVAQRGRAFSVFGVFQNPLFWPCMWPYFEQQVRPRSSWSPSQSELSYATRSSGEDRWQNYNNKEVTFRVISCSSSMHGFCLLAFYKVWSTAELRIIFKIVLRATQYKIKVFLYYSLLVSWSQCFRGLWAQSWCCWSSQSFVLNTEWWETF